MTTVDLRAIAEEATPGPWEWIEPHSVMHRYGGIAEAVAPVAAIEGLFSKRHRNGAHIAAWNPDRAIAALDVIDATKAMLAPEFSSEALANLRAAVARWEALA